MRLVACIVAHVLISGSWNHAWADDVRDANNRLIGRIVLESGRMVARDVNGAYLGYSPLDRSRTYDQNGRLIGNAYLLPVLVVEAHRRATVETVHPQDPLLTERDAALAKEARNRLLAAGMGANEIAWRNDLSGNHGRWQVDAGTWSAWDGQLTCRKLTMTVTTPRIEIEDRQEQIYCMDSSNTYAGWRPYSARRIESDQMTVR